METFSFSNASSIFNSNIWSIFFGYFLMDEVITWRVLISLSIIILGIYIVKKIIKDLNNI